jgi:hypothetical protein
MSGKTVALMALPLISLRVAFMAFPSLWLAAALWLIAAVMVFGWAVLLRRGSIPIHGAIAVATGAFSNGLVMVVNGGVMPVHGLSPDLDGAGWRSAEHGGHLLFLADYMSLGGASPGDMLIAAGILFTLAIPPLRALSRRLRPAAV